MDLKSNSKTKQAKKYFSVKFRIKLLRKKNKI